MKPVLALAFHRKAVCRVTKARRVRNPRMFKSVARGGTHAVRTARAEILPPGPRGERAR